MTKPRSGAYPRPWTTDTDPGQADVLIVGASSAKTFQVADVGSHAQFLDALWNRNGRTCRELYDAVTTKRSKTRPNLDRLSKMLAAHGLTSLQTNVSCASARYDAELSAEDRAHGTELFKVVVAHVPWRVMIVYGKDASKRFGQAFGVAMPPLPSPGSAPVRTTVLGREVFVAPTLAQPGYRTSVWPYLERVVAAIADGAPPIAPGMPTAFNTSAANQIVWQRMHSIAAASELMVNPSKFQATLTGGPKRSSTTRVFRHKFNKAKPDILVREDVFQFDAGLRAAAKWTTHKTPVFQSIRTDNMQLLDRILDAVEAFAERQAP